MKTALLLIISLSVISLTTQATPTYLTEPPHIQLAQNVAQSLNAASQSIKEQTGGRILSAKTVLVNGQRIHKIKVLLPSGKVKVFKVSAE